MRKEIAYFKKEEISPRMIMYNVLEYIEIKFKTIIYSCLCGNISKNCHITIIRAATSGEGTSFISW